MKLFARILAAALALCMIGSVAMAELTPGKIPRTDGEPITFTIGVGQNSMVEDWYTNAQTKKLEKDLNVKLEFKEYPSDSKEFIQKVELEIMAGGDELPDIIMSNLGGLANLVKYGQMGMIVPTTEYYKTHAYYTAQTLAVENMTIEEMLPYVTCYDGEVYGVFYYAASVNNTYSRSRLMVYEPWLQAMNMEKPQTTAEFAEMLRRFKNEDPNGNGVADEIPMMGYAGTLDQNFMQGLMNAFITTQDNYFYHNDGKIDFAANKDAWKEGVKWIKSLMDEGLISPLTLTQDQKQLTAVMNEEPEKVGVIARISATNLGATDTRRSQYICLDPLEGPEGERHAIKYARIPGIGMVITKNCKNPEAAFMLGDYMCEETMSVWNRYGEKGVDWDVPSEGAVGVYESAGFPAAIKVISTWGVLQNQWWAQVGPYVLLDKYASGQAVENVEYNGAVAIGRSMEKALEYATPAITGLVYNEEEQEVVTEYQSTINEYVKQSFAEFITGVKDIDAEWDNYVNEFSKMGLEPYMEAVNTCYARMYGE